MKYHIVSAALIIAAVVLEMSGYSRPYTDLGALLFTAGAACEFWFWVRLGLGKASRNRKTIV